MTPNLVILEQSNEEDIRMNASLNVAKNNKKAESQQNYQSLYPNKSGLSNKDGRID